MALLLRIGHEHDAVHAAQNQLAAGVVKDLSRNGVEVNARLEAAHRAQIQRQEVEEQGSIGLGGERDHLALLLFGCFLEDELQIRRLAAQPGAVVDDLAVDLACCEVDETQKVSSETPAKKTLANHSLNARASRYNSILTTLQYRLLLVFIPHRKALAQVTQVTKSPVTGCQSPSCQIANGLRGATAVAWQLALPIAASAADNIRAWHTPSRPDAAPAPRSRR